MMRFGPASGFAVFSCLALASCVDPKSDYDSFISRTADADILSPTGDDGSAGDGNNVSPDAGFSQQYVMACVSQIANDSVTNATYFTATITFKPTPGGGGTLDFTDQALPVGASTTSQAVGDVTTVNGSVVTPDGHCDVVFGMTTIPGAANPLTGTDIVFTDTTLHFVIGGGTSLCATLSGDLLQPFNEPLVANQNVCSFFATTGAVHVLTQADLTQTEMTCP